MKQNYTHIVLLIDRSGSMSSIKHDMEGGLMTFINEQKLEPGTCTVTAAQFDNVYEILFTRKDIQEITSIKIEPRASTSLIDSMCRLITEVGKDLDGLAEDEKPEKVLFVTITDGEENSSREFNSDQLKEMVKHQEDNYKWNFTYIGANQDAFANSQQYGLKGSNTLNFDADTRGVNVMFSKLSCSTSSYRASAGSDTEFSYTNDEN